jgi:hypothetical protein
MYSPKIKPEKVKALYQLKQRTGKKMTKLVDEAIAEYLQQQELALDSEMELNAESNKEAICGKQIKQDTRTLVS